jgi:hypothetical protein
MTRIQGVLMVLWERSLSARLPSLEFLLKNELSVKLPSLGKAKLLRHLFSSGLSGLK